MPFSAIASAIIDALGQDATVTRLGQPVGTVKGVVAESASDVFGVVGGSRLGLTVASNAAVTIQRGDEVTVGGKLYTITGIDEDSAHAGDRTYRLESAE